MGGGEPIRPQSRSRRRAALVVAIAVFSHWILDFIVHRPDLPLYDNTMKVGLGLWDYPAIALGLESALLFGGIWLYLAKATVRRLPFVIVGVVMLVIQVYIFFGPPPVSGKAAAWTALAAYAIFALVAARLEQPLDSADAGKRGHQVAN